MKKLLFYLTATLMVFASCSKNDFDFNQKDAVTSQYNAAFVKTFGQPGSNQTWGFANSKVTRSVIKENHELPDGMVKPTLENGEAEFVMNWFRNNDGEASVGKNWDKFFIVYVGGNNNVKIYSSWNGNIQNGNVTLDYLTINGEHINDWNANYGPTVYVYNSKADNFTSHNSYSNFTTNKWKLAEITYNGKVGYYVGLSAYSRKNETPEKYQLTDYDRENFYDDWVFKIVPANGVTPPSDKLRIIAEDLTAKDGTDFDFNDVVIDVDIEGTTANCKLIAAGGTLPLRIAGNDELEVHKLFGVGTSVMVNTGIGEPLPYVPFTLSNVSSAANIKLEVFKNGEWMEMEAKQGVPAAKIAVNQDFDYCGEREPITSKYPNFKHWVQNIDYIWW